MFRSKTAAAGGVPTTTASRPLSSGRSVRPVRSTFIPVHRGPPLAGCCGAVACSRSERRPPLRSSLPSRPPAAAALCRCPMDHHGRP
eukprot:scaffold40234_cov68-Phaeocystis_antarctica.AAC.1